MRRQPECDSFNSETWNQFCGMMIYYKWDFLIAQLVKNPPAMQETPVQSLVRKICRRRNRLPTPVLLGFPCGSAGKESVCNVGDLGSIPGLERSPREEKDYPLQYSGLENSMDCICPYEHRLQL